jgi:uncharacterized membrane protein
MVDSANSNLPAASGKNGARQLQMDLLVGYLLLGGVLLSLALVAAGLAWKWLATGRPILDYRLGGMNLFQLIIEEARLVAHGAIRPRLLVTFGIVVLMLTPYLRVLASFAYFLGVLKNWKYTLFTAVVFIVLTYSLFLR